MTKNSYHPLYHTWIHMIYRCERPLNDSWPYYGGRGIRVCDRWHDMANFIADMGERPVGTTLDRINANGDYEPNNCRWATPLEQSRNRRNIATVTLDGVSYKAVELAEASGRNHKTIRARAVRGLSLADVVSPMSTYDNSPNIAKAIAGAAAVHYARTHCRRGHELSPENIKVHGKQRRCKICARMRGKKYDAIRRAKPTHDLPGSQS